MPVPHHPGYSREIEPGGPEHGAGVPNPERARVADEPVELGVGVREEIHVERLRRVGERLLHQRHEAVGIEVEQGERATVAPAVGAFARFNFIDTVNEATYITDAENYEARAAQILADGGKPVPAWYKDWEKTGLLEYNDLNGDGVMQYRGPAAPDGLANEVVPNRDIFVLANPQIANLPGWVIGLVVAGGLAAALSTAAGLLMVISSAVSHDLLKRTFTPDMTEKQEMLAARLAAAVAVFASGMLGIFATQLPFVAQVVAFAFGLAAASLFPVIFLGIFWKRMNREGAISAMLTGLITTFGYIYYFKFVNTDSDLWLFGVSPEGIGFVFMWLAAAVGVIVSLMTAAPPQEVQDLVIHFLEIKY